MSFSMDYSLPHFEQQVTTGASLSGLFVESAPNIWQTRSIGKIYSSEFSRFTVKY